MNSIIVILAPFVGGACGTLGTLAYFHFKERMEAKRAVRAYQKALDELDERLAASWVAFEDALEKLPVEERQRLLVSIRKSEVDE